jgi:hypothetical protein
MKLAFDLKDITIIEFFNNDCISVWFGNSDLDLIISKGLFEKWLESKQYDPNITYDHKDVFEERVKEYLESKCIDEPIPAHQSSLIKESLDLVLQVSLKLSILQSKLK